MVKQTDSRQGVVTCLVSTFVGLIEGDVALQHTVDLRVDAASGVDISVRRACFFATATCRDGKESAGEKQSSSIPADRHAGVVPASELVTRHAIVCVHVAHVRDSTDRKSAARRSARCRRPLRLTFRSRSIDERGPGRADPSLCSASRPRLFQPGSGMHAQYRPAPAPPHLRSG